jgi:hypothetical protein
MPTVAMHQLTVRKGFMLLWEPLPPALARVAVFKVADALGVWPLYKLAGGNPAPAPSALPLAELWFTALDDASSKCVWAGN